MRKNHLRWDWKFEPCGSSSFPPWHSSILGRSPPTKMAIITAAAKSPEDWQMPAQVADSHPCTSWHGARNPKISEKLAVKKKCSIFCQWGKLMFRGKTVSKNRVFVETNFSVGCGLLVVEDSVTGQAFDWLVASLITMSVKSCGKLSSHPSRHFLTSSPFSGCLSDIGTYLYVRWTFMYYLYATVMKS